MATGLTGYTAAARRNSIVRLYGLLIWALLTSLAAARNGPEYWILEKDDGEVFFGKRQNSDSSCQSNCFTGALAIYGSPGGGPSESSGSGMSGGGGGGGSSQGQGGSTAVPAQCPADHPVSCTNIQQPNYCCPSNNYCSWADSTVACCPNGQTCSGPVQSGGGGSYQPPATSYQPAPQAPPATTVVVAGGGGNGGQTGYIVTTTENHGGGGYVGYCSTLYAKGPDLPATQAGQCGTILILEAEAIQASVLGWAKLATMMLGLHLLGVLFFLQR